MSVKAILVGQQTEFPIPVAKGGTGASAAAAARSNLGAANVTSGTATCPAAASWSGPTSGLYYTTVSISGFTANTRVHITPIISTSDTSTGEAQQEAWDTHYTAETVSGGIKFYAEETPTVAVTFMWEVVS